MILLSLRRRYAVDSNNAESVKAKAKYSLGMDKVEGCRTVPRIDMHM
jgi:hypothetical protein